MQMNADGSILKKSVSRSLLSKAVWQGDSDDPFTRRKSSKTNESDENNIRWCTDENAHLLMAEYLLLPLSLLTAITLGLTYFTNT